METSFSGIVRIVAALHSLFPAKSEPAEPATHVPLGGPSVILSPAAGRLGGCEVRRRVRGPDVR